MCDFCCVLLFMTVSAILMCVFVCVFVCVDVCVWMLLNVAPNVIVFSKYFLRLYLTC